MAGVMRAHPGIVLTSRGDPFQTLARSIVGQQISVKAADSVWRRLVDAVGMISPDSLIRAGPARLVRCGLSGRKVEYLTHLARHCVGGGLDIDAWRKLHDEEVIARLVEVRGIGRWTAEMFLIFNMLRPDVLPVDDLGVLRAVSQLYYCGEPIPREALVELGRTWAPWRSVATWYLWRSLDPVPVEY